MQARHRRHRGGADCNAPLACGSGQDEDPTTGSGAGTDIGRCQQFESFSGRLRVGNPTSRPNDQPADGPLMPGETLPLITYPILEKVRIEGTGASNAIVFELSGDGMVGWSARFVEVPFSRGSDAPVPVSGSCILQLDLSGVDTAGSQHEKDSPARLSPEGNASVVVEALNYPSSGTIAQSFVGTRTADPTVTFEASAARGTLAITLRE